MIDFVEGIVAYTELDHVVIDTGGIGYRVFCPNPFAFRENEGKVRLFTHYHVREDAALLYGFATREERALFRKLLDVSGIGPKGALAVVAYGLPREVAAAIYREDVSFLTKFPGVGKKTAQRIILDLKDKLDEFVHPASAAAAINGDAMRIAEGIAWDTVKIPVLTETIEALKALGYHDKEVEKIEDRLKEAVEEARQNGTGEPSTDELIKQALRLLVRG